MAYLGSVAADPEGIDGIRMTWNNWPRSKIEVSKCIFPIAASISLIRPNPDLAILPYPPLRCNPPCSAMLNPFCRMDFAAKIWIFPFCFSRNHFPHYYSGISENNLPGELYLQHTTIEYALPASHDPAVAAAATSPVFLFVLDTCLIEEELEFVKSAMWRAIGLLLENALVGLISFGTQVHVHEQGFLELSKIYVFWGTKELTKEQILDHLRLVVGQRAAVIAGAAAGYPKGMPTKSLLVNQFLMPASECEYTLNSLLDELQRDQWPVEGGSRALRCAEVALCVAESLLGACLSRTGARIVALVGGACTVGPGLIVSKDLTEPVHSHKDPDKDAAPHFHKAVKFYDTIAKHRVSQGHVLDLFASALDQVGVAKMKVIVERAGGLAVLS